MDAAVVESGTQFQDGVIDVVVGERLVDVTGHRLRRVIVSIDASKCCPTVVR
ncbi:hypothetical protein [Halomicrococcus gelatinilyticus]|uniref:hypothetical protein n=1 Tax=Halomicrococcus gelatinilyticus TaxID=1702103 RepID=UPI002E16503F